MAAASASNTKTEPIHLLSGSDEDAVKKAGAELAKKLAPQDAMNLEIVDGRADSVDEAARSIEKVREAILTLPFFGGGKLVWWKSVNLFDDSGPGRHESVKEALESLVPDLDRVDGESVTLMITALGLHRGRAFSKALLKRAKARSFDLPDLQKTSEVEIIFQIERRMQAVGIQPGPGAAERFYEATGIDTALWTAELEKLACYNGEAKAELTREDVSRIISGTREVLIWDFCHAVLGGDAKLALALLSNLFAQDEKEIGLLIVLAHQVRSAALAATLRENKMLHLTGRGTDVSPAATPYLPRKKDGETVSTYALGQTALRSQHHGSAFWFRALARLFDAQRTMLAGAGDHRRTLELAVLEIVGGAAKA